jgi:hypothetical protein
LPFRFNLTASRSLSVFWSVIGIKACTGQPFLRRWFLWITVSDTYLDRY